MIVETVRFGSVEVDDETLIHFPEGLYGLPDDRLFCLITDETMPSIWWLQSTNTPWVTLMVTDPFRYFPTYELVVPDQTAASLKTEEAGDLVVYTTLTADSKEPALYANLLGPIVINYQERLGAQVAQDSNRYSARHRVTPVAPHTQN